MRAVEKFDFVLFLLGGSGFGLFGNLVVQTPHYEQSVQNADRTEDVERAPPAPTLANPAGEKPAYDYAEIVRCLVDAHRRAARVFVVVVGDCRVVGGPESRLAHARCDTAEENEKQKPVARARGDCRAAPKNNAEHNNPLAADSVGDEARNRHEQREDEAEQRRDKPRLAVGQF